MRTLERQWLILSRLPRSPRKVDAAWLEAELREMGVVVHRRSIQRDLIALSRMFPLVCDEASKPYGWSWATDADGPGARVSPHAALLIVLGARVFDPILPRATSRFVLAELPYAERVLANAGPAFAGWVERVKKCVRLDVSKITRSRVGIPD
jgi:predicted DNA-binding transcriptional regulator YafY